MVKKLSKAKRLVAEQVDVAASVECKIIRGSMERSAQRNNLSETREACPEFEPTIYDALCISTKSRNCGTLAVVDGAL
jgi:hypothetical protein